MVLKRKKDRLHFFFFFLNKVACDLQRAQACGMQITQGYDMVELGSGSWYIECLVRD